MNKGLDRRCFSINSKIINRISSFKKKEKNNIFFFTNKDLLDVKSFIHNTRQRYWAKSNSNVYIEEIFLWDRERNMFYTKRKFIKLYSRIIFKRVNFIFREEIFRLDCFKNYIAKKSQLLPSKSGEKNLLNCLSFLVLISNGLIAYRFFFSESFLLRPNFLCSVIFRKKKKIFTVINFRKSTNFSKFKNFNLLLYRLKPMILKIMIFGESSFLIYKVQPVIISSSPLTRINLKKDKKNKKK
jgi:hypothetical protein